MHLIAAVLIALNVYVFAAVFGGHPHELRVSVLNIGQGDSILIESPTGIRVLVDGGPSSVVLGKLQSELGLLDRSIDMLVETHPDKDHIGGLPSVFKRYRISYFMEPVIPNDTAATAAVLRAAQDEPGLTHVTARRGMRLDLGGGAYADVLYPDRDPAKLDTNNGSVVLHVVYGSTSFMLTGDLPSEQEDWLITLDGKDGNLASDVLKAGHHGSKYSTDDAWLAAVHPSVVAISAGKDNPYGHPNPETMARIRNEGATIYSTVDSGTLHFISDGNTITER
jgi:competence protein ComEC